MCRTGVASILHNLSNNGWQALVSQHQALLANKTPNIKTTILETTFGRIAVHLGEFASCCSSYVYDETRPLYPYFVRGSGDKILKAVITSPCHKIFQPIYIDPVHSGWSSSILGSCSWVTEDGAGDGQAVWGAVINHVVMQELYRTVVVKKYRFTGLFTLRPSPVVVNSW